MTFSWTIAELKSFNATFHYYFSDLLFSISEKLLAWPQLHICWSKVELRLMFLCYANIVHQQNCLLGNYSLWETNSNNSTYLNSQIAWISSNWSISWWSRLVKEFPKISRYALIFIFLYYVVFGKQFRFQVKKYFIPLYHVELDCGTPRIFVNLFAQKTNHVNIKLKLLPGKKTGKRKVLCQE